MKFNSGQAWNDGIAKVRDNFQLLAIIGGVFFFLPAILMVVLLPDTMAMMTQPTFDPEESQKMLEAIGPGFFATYAVAMLATFTGYVAMMALMADRSRPTVGEAIVKGLKALPTLFVVMLIFMVGYFVLALAAGLLIGLASVISGVLAGIIGFVAVIAVLVGLVLLATRMSMTMPVIALENTLNPVTAVKRSAALTGPVQWPLLGFFAVLTIAYIVIALILFGVLGVITAMIGAPVVLGIFNGIVGTIVAMVFTGITAAIYDQLSGGDPGKISDTFE